MLKHTKTLTAAMLCIAMALCVSCKKNNAEPSSGGGGGDTPTPTPTTDAYVDLGLPSGLLWAKCNVGAENPEDYGNYFAWGEIEPKENYDWDTYKLCNGSSTTLTKYNTSESYGTVDNKTVLEMSDDAARANLGENWRMPTKDEFEELQNNCTWTLTTQNGKNGYCVTGSNGNSIFLPYAGFYSGSIFDLGDSNGIYWSSSLDSDNPGTAYGSVIGSGNPYMYADSRIYGLPVRPVCSSQKQ